MIRPQVAISSCLLGERVRYDGQHKRSPFVANRLMHSVDVVSVCPEVGCGMPIPRSPIHLVKTNTGLRLQSVNTPKKDFSYDMQEYFSRELDVHEQTAGLVCKSKSPSCGRDDTPITDVNSPKVKFGAGYFVRLFHREFPHVPVIDERHLEHEDYRHRFLVHCYTIARYYQIREQNPDNAIRVFHAKNRLLLASINPEKAQELDKVLSLLQNGRATEKNYLQHLSYLLQMPFNAMYALQALERFTGTQDFSTRSALRLMYKSLKQRDHDQLISVLFYQHIDSLMEQLNITHLAENSFFKPYPTNLVEN